MSGVRQLVYTVWSTAVAFLGAMGASLSGNESIGQITASQWVTMTLAGLVAGGSVLGFTRYQATAGKA